MAAIQRQVFLGTFIHSKALGELEYLHDTAVCVDETGKIVAVEPLCDRAKAEREILPRLGWAAADVAITACKPSQFFFPGFIDTHIHASQYPNVGIFGKSTLLDWLITYTFPLEASLADLKKARTVYSRCVRRMLAHGTTAAAYYATVDVASTNLLADLCLAAGQRALVGRVCMDANSPDWYRDESAADALEATRRCVAHVRSIDPEGRLVRPVLTPRFAPACSPELMRGLSDLQARTGLPVQTHISETLAELDLVRATFPGVGDGTYAGVYDAFGLLGRRTILAHAVYLGDAEADLVRRRGAKVSHCPCSNGALGSGAARVRWLLGQGIDVGLGTDMSGGYSPSVLEAARQAALVSRQVALAAGGDDAAKLSAEEVLHLATRGGARVLGLEDRVGGFEVGMEWDAQLVALGLVGEEDGGDGAGDDTNVDVFGWETWPERVAKWLFGGDDRNTRKVWVQGRLVHERA